jgi:RNA polymerase sigma-70 factor, ECF subfamily
MDAAQHDIAAWLEQLYLARSAEIILYGRALGLSQAEAEDVLQETFLALLRLERMPDEPAFYCLRAFRNRALNHKRGLFRRLARELEAQSWFEPPAGESPQERAALRALARLPREQREVIVLKIWHQHTFEEIGGLLDLSPHTAAGRYRYGMNKLRAFLEETSHERTEPSGEPFAFLDATPSVHQP